MSFAGGNIGKWQNLNLSLSGLAKMNTPLNNAQFSFVGVVDNKSGSSPSKPRVAIINLDANYGATVAYTPQWPGEDPDDLESVAAVPNGATGANQQFVATNSSGEFWRFTITNNGEMANVVKSTKDLHREGDNGDAKQIESIAFYVTGTEIKLVWAGRGSRDHSARLFIADYIDGSTPSYENHSDKKIQEGRFSWGRPVWSNDSQSRLVTDIKIARSPNGKTYSLSAFDGGDDGPFAGVLYNLGQFSNSGSFTLSSDPLKPKTAMFIGIDGKKAEALEMLGDDASDGFIIGSDDEKLGGSVLILKSLQ
jgi:hypothetical protein